MQTMIGMQGYYHKHHFLNLSRVTTPKFTFVEILLLLWLQCYLLTYPSSLATTEWKKHNWASESSLPLDRSSFIGPGMASYFSSGVSLAPEVGQMCVAALVTMAKV